MADVSAIVLWGPESLASASAAPLRVFLPSDLGWSRMWPFRARPQRQPAPTCTMAQERPLRQPLRRCQRAVACPNASKLCTSLRDIVSSCEVLRMSVGWAVMNRQGSTAHELQDRAHQRRQHGRTGTIDNTADGTRSVHHTARHLLVLSAPHAQSSRAAPSACPSVQLLLLIPVLLFRLLPL